MSKFFEDNVIFDIKDTIQLLPKTGPVKTYKIMVYIDKDELVIPSVRLLAHLSAPKDVLECASYVLSHCVQFDDFS